VRFNRAMRMRSLRPARVAFVAALVSGAAMIGASVHGMLGIDRQLEHSAQAAQRTTTPHVIRVRGVDCTHRVARI
jgi:hypothetical protein